MSITFIEFIYYKNYPCTEEVFVDFGQVIYYDEDGNRIDTHNFNNIGYYEFMLLYDLFGYSKGLKKRFKEYDLKMK